MSSNPTILLLGKNGMLGKALEKAFQAKDPQGAFFHVTEWGREELDITNKKSVHEKITGLRPQIVINATGYTNVDGAETERETAFMVNAEGVGYIAEACAEIGATLIHFSTDYVFDGTQAGGYREEDEAHLKPLNAYGESKLQGEFLIQSQKSKFPPEDDQPLVGKTLRQRRIRLWRKNHNLKLKTFRYFIVRTSWLYGAGGKNFVDTLITRAKDEQREFKVVNDQFGKPTYTGDLAEHMVWMVENRDRLQGGVYHCTNEVNSKFPPEADQPLVGKITSQNSKFYRRHFMV